MEENFFKKPGFPGFPDSVLLDRDDYVLDSNHCWYKRDDGYIVRGCCVVRKDGTLTRRLLRLHRVIASRMLVRPLLPKEIVDHKNGNKSDNRRANLRVVNHGINSQNMKGATTSNVSSGVRGVSWNKRCKLWFAHMVIGAHQFNLGYYHNVKDAISIAQEARERWMPGYLIDCYGDINY